MRIDQNDVKINLLPASAYLVSGKRKNEQLLASFVSGQASTKDMSICDQSLIVDFDM